MTVNKMKWFIRSLVCLIKGHKDIAVFFNPIDGSRDLGFICSRCSRPKHTTWETFLWR